MSATGRAKPKATARMMEKVRIALDALDFGLRNKPWASDTADAIDHMRALMAKGHLLTVKQVGLIWDIYDNFRAGKYDYRPPKSRRLPNRVENLLAPAKLAEASKRRAAERRAEDAAKHAESLKKLGAQP